MSFSGIDVSKHNGVINWKKVKTEGKIDFAMIRAGYGNNNIDPQLHNNVIGCKENGIDFGFYWFSYALTENAVINEANYLCNIADKYKPTYPLCFDWEYDSDNYAKKKGVAINNATRSKFAKAFLKTVEKRGYYAMIYSNADYLNKGFRELLNDYALWFASWTGKKPSIRLGIWQNSDKGVVPGISGKVDSDISYVDYPAIINSWDHNQQQTVTKPIKKIKTEEEFKNEFWEKYYRLAKDILNGKYGNGADREKNLKAAGFDYTLAQEIVNNMI